ncbi:unnamed protein product [Candida verbasci]|uniref:Jacalin-type lectin domain-containing protein n=1 Tax=Candida verbasci TaxID=1227364 RepID=A0A9W4TYD0_9ASCO|nr:unnamed protein product [Candida verbasci]
MAIKLNYQNDEIVSTPTVIVSGQTTNCKTGIVSFTNNENKVFPPQYFEINNGQFKAILHVSENERNVIKIEVMKNGVINEFGFPTYNGHPNVVDTGYLAIHHNPLPQNKPIHLCLIRGRDSLNTYDTPKYKLNRGEIPTLESAVKKLKVAGRLMQAYTQEEMRLVGFSNRSFQFVEEETHDQGLFGYKVKSPTPHKEIKIFILTSPLSVSELRSYEYAQQNPQAKENGFLFSHAIDLVKQNKEIYRGEGTAIQAACMYLDSTWDRKFILTHAALGGGTNEVKMAIFGSHGLHSYPINFPNITPAFLDSIHLSTNEVANDCNECGTSWECLNICLGAFMHEIGHSLGCPHQIDGVMLRDYVWFNRSFMTRELESLRRKTRGEVIGGNGWGKTCHWNRLDLIRFLMHDSFSLPIDQFEHIYSTTRRPDGTYQLNSVPLSVNLPGGKATVESKCGIFLIELITQDLARYHVEYLPKQYGGKDLQHNMELNYHELYKSLKLVKSDAGENFSIRILSLGGDLFINNAKEFFSSQNFIMSDFGLGRGKLQGIKSSLLGRENGNLQYGGFNIKSIYKIKIYHGGALDGIKFYYENGTITPTIPPRNYIKGLIKHHVNAQNGKVQGGSDAVTLIGKETNNYSTFKVPPGEFVTEFNVRNGAWVDAIQFITNKGNKSPMFGNANGGHLSILKSPNDSLSIVGMYFYMGSWIDGLGLIYA